jgi:hypothetical protein
VVVPPGMPLQFVYSIMQEQGLNYLPVIRYHGPLDGMITRLVDCLQHTDDAYALAIIHITAECCAGMTSWQCKTSS